MWIILRLANLLVSFCTASSFVLGMTIGPGEVRGPPPTSRLEALNEFTKLAATAAVSGVLVARPLASSAAQKINNSLGRESFRKIWDARELLDRVDVPLIARKFDEVQELLEDPVSTKLDKALVDLVQSNVLPSEDKVSVGTIRRYGLAADALIALGGLSAAARDGDGGEARRMLILTKEALNDILTIGVNNKLNKT